MQGHVFQDKRSICDRVFLWDLFPYTLLIYFDEFNCVSFFFFVKNDNVLLRVSHSINETNMRLSWDIKGNEWNNCTDLKLQTNLKALMFMKLFHMKKKCFCLIIHAKSLWNIKGNSRMHNVCFVFTGKTKLIVKNLYYK